MMPPSLPFAAGAAVGVYVLLLAVAHLLQRVRALRFSWPYHLFAAAAGLFAGALAAPAGLPWIQAATPHLIGAFIVLAAYPVVILVNRMLWVRHAPDGSRIEAPRVLSDATGFAVFAAAVLLVLQFVYDVKVPGLLAGSGVIALVLGLGCQEQLHNLAAGISLYLEKPFKAGDWLLIDGTHAKVLSLSWRSTELVTIDEVLIDVANSTILKQTITNFARPTPLHSVRAQIGLHYDTPPVQAQMVLRKAAASVPGVSAEPAPSVLVKDFGDSAIVYEIVVWITDHALMNRVLSEVRSHCWYAVRRAGMEIPYPQLTVHHAPPPPDAAAARAAAATALQGNKIFGFLTAGQIAVLVREARVVQFARSEPVIEQGTPGDSMFLLVRGSVDVRLLLDGQVSTVAHLGPDDCFGEMSLLTGEPRTATVVTTTEVEAVEISKPAFAAIVHSSPTVLERLSDLLAQRQLANAQFLASAGPRPSPEEVRNGFLTKLRAFFQLG